MSDSDFLAVITINGGSSWARHRIKDKAIANVAKIFRSDWGRLFHLKKGDERTVEVVDVTGYDDICWGYDAEDGRRGASRKFSGFFFKNADGTKGRIDGSRIEYTKVKLS